MHSERAGQPGLAGAGPAYAADVTLASPRAVAAAQSVRARFRARPAWGAQHVQNAK